MAILGVQFQNIGQSGQTPNIVYINTNDTLATVTASGYLNGLIRENVPINTAQIACVRTMTSPQATTSSTGFFDITVSNGVWSLSASESTAPLASGHIFVGNASNVATDVAMSGDATMANTGALTIASGAINNAKVSATAAIAFSKLAALNSGDLLIGNASNVATDTAMSGDATISNTGVLTVGAGAISSSKIASSVIQYARVNVTLATFLAMYDTPITLVSAAGANTILLLEQLQVVQTYGSAALASGGVSAVQYDVTAHGAGTIASTTLTAATYQATASGVYTYNPGVVVLPFTTCVNKPLALSCLTGDFTTGTGSTFICHVWYRVAATV